MFGIGLLRSCEPGHPRVRELLDSDERRGEEGCGLGPDGFVEGKGVGEEAVGAAGKDK